MIIDARLIQALFNQGYSFQLMWTGIMYIVYNIILNEGSSIHNRDKICYLAVCTFTYSYPSM